MTSLEQWLSVATQSLSAESAAHVRAEIRQHCDSACDTGETVEAAVVALGDPRAANRAYRKVLLTEREAAMASGFTRFHRPSVWPLARFSALAAGLAWWLSRWRHGPGFWPISVAMYCCVLIAWLYPSNTPARCRSYIGILGVQSIILGAIAWWYSGWIFGLTLAATMFLFGYLHQHQKMSVFRKVEAGQTYRLRPEELMLTPIESMVLGRLQNGEPYENVSTAVLFTIIAVMTVWLPDTFVPMTACILVIFLTQRMLPIYDEERGRRYRIAKWTMMAIAACMPALYGARLPWAGALFLANLFRLFDMKNISIRRKLPVEQWPKRLYW